MRRHRKSGVSGPLAPYAAGLGAELERQGYAPASVRSRLSQLNQLSLWLDAEGLAPSGLTDEQVERFVATRRRAGLVSWISPVNLDLPLEYLRCLGVAPARASAPAPATDPLDGLLESYGCYLVTERGVVASTIRTYLRVARSFCLELRGRGRELQELRAADVSEFIVATCRGSSPARAKKTVTALASLLRYLYVAGVTTGSFAFALPKVAGHRPEPPKRAIADADVARLLSSCDRRRNVGRRDYAILTLLARLGLRAGEVTKLTLDDIDWHHGEVVIRGKADRQERLPIPVDVGEALSAYLRRSRPQVPGCRTVFVRSRAPFGPLASSSIGAVVARVGRRAGLGQLGAHRLRHHAATATLGGGAPLAEVAQLLRQRTLLVTASYARAEPAALRELARPWPGGVR